MKCKCTALARLSRVVGHEIKPTTLLVSLHLKCQGGIPLGWPFRSKPLQIQSVSPGEQKIVRNSVSSQCSVMRKLLHMRKSDGSPPTIAPQLARSSAHFSSATVEYRTRQTTFLDHSRGRFVRTRRSWIRSGIIPSCRSIGRTWRKVFTGELPPPIAIHIARAPRQLSRAASA